MYETTYSTISPGKHSFTTNGIVNEASILTKSSMKMLFQIQERITPEMLGTISRLAAFEMHIIRQVSITSTVIMTR